MNKPLPTGWADWQLKVDKLMPHAKQWVDFTPIKAEKTAMAAELPDGVRVRLEQNSEKFEQWVPAGWQITLPTSPNATMIAYGWKVIGLPVGLELLDFDVKRNEGSDSPASFKSTLRVVAADGETATGSCWMNNPFSFPGAWWRTWTGLTYKISQASWNPENLGQSTVQILRDPGWLLKWIGSLLVVTGVFMMFYLQPYRRQTAGEPIAPAGSTVNGASIPRSLWSLMGGPFEGKYRDASVLHDVSYEQHKRPWQDCDRMFYNAMRCSGVSAVEAKTMFYALYRFGHHWKFPIKRAKPVKFEGAMVARGEEIPRAIPVNENDVNEARDWIRRAQPSLQEIEQRAETEAW